MHLGASLWNWNLFRQRGQHPLMLGLLINSFGLIYDNLILGIGSWVPMHILEILSVLRFVLHALFTPTMVLTGLYIANENNLSWAVSPTMHRFTALVVVLLVLVGIKEHLLDYETYPVCLQNGLVHYSAIEVHPHLHCDGFSYPDRYDQVGAPASAISTIMILILMGIQVALVGDGWLLLGSLFMFVAAAAVGTMGWDYNTTLWLGNAGEVLLVFFMNLAMQRAPAKSARKEE